MVGQLSASLVGNTGRQESRQRALRIECIEITSYGNVIEEMGIPLVTRGFKYEIFSNGVIGAAK